MMLLKWQSSKKYILAKFGQIQNMKVDHLKQPLILLGNYGDLLIKIYIF
jgi:hypothetical protein